MAARATKDALMDELEEDLRSPRQLPLPVYVCYTTERFGKGVDALRLWLVLLLPLTSAYSEQSARDQSGLYQAAAIAHRHLHDAERWAGVRPVFALLVAAVQSIGIAVGTEKKLNPSIMTR